MDRQFEADRSRNRVEHSKRILVLAGLFFSACGGPLSVTDNSREGFFGGEGVELHYVLDLPEGSPPFPGVVMSHGSGPKQIRDLESWAARLVAHGFAVLRFDKRGTGESGGFHTPSSSGEVNRAIRDDFASDLVAGFEFMISQSEIDPSNVGFFGESQAGWTIAVAQADVDEAFNVVLSGPTLPLGDVGLFESAANADPMRPPSETWDALVQAGRLDHQGLDPRPYLERLDSPGLWVFGAWDLNVPTEASASELRTLRDVGGKAISIVTYPDADHGLRHHLSGKPVDYWPDVLDFLQFGRSRAEAP